MDLKSSELMARIAELNKKPVMMSGYLVTDGNRENDKIRLYPRLDPRRYYAFGKDCVIGAQYLEGDKDGYVTVLIDPDCEIEVLCQEPIVAKELAKKTQESPCGCGDEDVILKEKLPVELLQGAELALYIAQFLVSWGVTELRCFGFNSMKTDCCLLWNRLLRAVKEGREGEARTHAQEVASCLE